MQREAAHTRSCGYINAGLCLITSVEPQGNIRAIIQQNSLVTNSHTAAHVIAVAALTLLVVNAFACLNAELSKLTLERFSLISPKSHLTAVCSLLCLLGSDANTPSRKHG